MKTIKELQQEAHQIAKDKGFWDNTERVINFLKDSEDELIDENFNNIISTKIALIITELSEAIEALRKKKKANIIEFNRVTEGLTWENNQAAMEEAFRLFIKDSVQDEISDAQIRIYDLCSWLNIDLENHVIMKMDYNKTRPYKHGKTF